MTYNIGLKIRKRKLYRNGWKDHRRQGFTGTHWVHSEFPRETFSLGGAEKADKALDKNRLYL
jgi:hypothetical protein